MNKAGSRIFCRVGFFTVSGLRELRGFLERKPGKEHFVRVYSDKVRRESSGLSYTLPVCFSLTFLRKVSRCRAKPDPHTAVCGNPCIETPLLKIRGFLERKPGKEHFVRVYSDKVRRESSGLSYTLPVCFSLTFLRKVSRCRAKPDPHTAVCGIPYIETPLLKSRLL